LVLGVSTFDEELRSLAENSTWDYVGLEDVLADVTPISSKWVFKTKQLPGAAFGNRPGLLSEALNSRRGLTSMKLLLQ